MTYAVALQEAQKLKTIMEGNGVRCSIELQGGRGTDPWAVPAKWVRMHHHVASRYVPGGNLTPMLYLVKQGRPNDNLPGPLANGYGGFDLVYRILCMGLANHPGLGGPITIDGVYIPKDSAREPTWGTEFEGGYQDWEIIPGMLEFMGRVDASLAEYGVWGTARPLTSQMEHKTWAPTRKVDRLNFTRASGIALTQRWAERIGTPKEEEEVFNMYAFRSDTGNTANRPWAVCSDGGEVHLFGSAAQVTPFLRPGDEHRPNEEYWAGAKVRAFWTPPGEFGFPVNLPPGDWDHAVQAARQRRRKIAQQIWFVNDPASDGVFLVYGSTGKLLFPATPEGQQSLANHKSHWGAQGYDTTTYTWSDNDINIVPEVGSPPS